MRGGWEASCPRLSGKGMPLIRTFVVKASNRVGPAGGPLGVPAHAAGPLGAVVPVGRVHAVQVHHVVRHHGVLAWRGPSLQSKHVEETLLEVAQEALRALGALPSPGLLAVLPPAHLGNESRSASQQHLSQQQYHERAERGDHDQSVPARAREIGEEGEVAVKNRGY